MDVSCRVSVQCFWILELESVAGLLLVHMHEPHHTCVDVSCYVSLQGAWTFELESVTGLLLLHMHELRHTCVHVSFYCTSKLECVMLLSEYL